MFQPIYVQRFRLHTFSVSACGDSCVAVVAVAGMHRVWKDEFVNMLGIAPGHEAGSTPPKVLDVAGGTGDIAFR